MLITDLVFLSKVYHQQASRLWKTNPRVMAEATHVPIFSSDTQRRGPVGSLSSKTPSLPFKLWEKGVFQLCQGVQGPWDKLFPLPSGGVCDGAGEMGITEELRADFSIALLKTSLAKLQRFRDIMLVELFFPLGHVLEGIAGRKSSWMSNSIDPPARITQDLSLTPVSPSLPLNLPLDKICLDGDMFSPKEIFTV